MEQVANIVASILPLFEDWLRATVRDEMQKTLEADRLQAKPSRMLTRQEVCDMLHISSVTLWQKTNSGEIEATRVGRRVLYSESEIKRYLEG